MTNHNYSIDVLKFVAAVMVVIVHMSDWFAHQALMPLVRCAVPCFFMISGYLLYSRDGIGRERLLRNVRHIAWMCAWTMVLFAVLDVCCIVFAHLREWPTLKDLRNLIFLNVYPFSSLGGHLWYILAYLYVLLIMMFVDKHRLWRWLFAATPLLWAGYMWLEYHQFPDITYRNFLFEGIPCFAVGAMVKHWRDCIFKCLNRKLAWGGAVFFLVLVYTEAYSHDEITHRFCRESFFSTPFLSLFLLLSALSTPTTKPNWASRMGCNYSTYIYIFHTIFVRGIFRVTLPQIPPIYQTIYWYTSPIIILVCCVAMTWALRRMKVKI